ncbi:hypothetical protein [Nitriliruptor alkaliphilus]|uniref:hypothetical protein n=1 Tax=Nitriliruptor alkaliphilus TaxID=427918 RepID=UPI0012EE17B4|nr:hypothetical protein [Nitriliruptor alkaliphilus]
MSASRLSQRRHHLRHDDAQQLAGRLRKRAAVSFWHVHPSLVGDLAAEPGCVLAGRSAAERVGADLAGHSGPLEVSLPAPAADRLDAWREEDPRGR